MSDLRYDPDTNAAERWQNGCHGFDDSDEFPVKAWDWLTALPVPPAWLVGLLEYHYRGTDQYACDVEDRLGEMEGE